MSEQPDQPEFPFHGEISDLVDSVRALGERARFLAINLAVAAAKLKQEGLSSNRLNEEILDLVARMTRASQDVNDALNAIDSGAGSSEKTSPRMWSDWRETGIPDQRTLDRLENSLQETLELSKYIFRWMKELRDVDTGPGKRHRQMPRESLRDDRTTDERI